MKPSIIKEKSNGWDGWAKETIKLQSWDYKGKTYYQVTRSQMAGKHEVKNYRTLKGAEKRYAFLENIMTVKEA